MWFVYPSAGRDLRIRVPLSHLFLVHVSPFRERSFPYLNCLPPHPKPPVRLAGSFFLVRAFLFVIVIGILFVSSFVDAIVSNIECFLCGVW